MFLWVGERELEVLRMWQTVETPDMLVVGQCWVVETLNKLQNLHTVSVCMCVCACLSVRVSVYVSVSVCMCMCAEDMSHDTSQLAVRCEL